MVCSDYSSANEAFVEENYEVAVNVSIGRPVLSHSPGLSHPVPVSVTLSLTLLQ